MRSASYFQLFTVLLGLAFVLLLGCSSGAESRETAEAVATQDTRPNILFILADDLGYADIGPFGQRQIRTPNLDRLAREGMRFTQHYAGNTVCAPSRCALMTGLHMGHAAVRGNAQDEPHGQIPLPEEAVTVAELLQGSGYETALIGKWGLGIEQTSGDPLRQGFDSYYGYLDQVLAHNYYPEYLLRDGAKERLANEVVYLDSSAWHRGLGSYAVTQRDYSHDRFTQETLDFLARDRDRPFFLYLALTIPHNNGEAPAGFKQEVPDLAPYDSKSWPRETKAYAAMITRMDRDIGRIMDRLRAEGLAENTLVIFTSDNGPMTQPDFTEFFDSNGPLRGGKRDLYEGGVRVPFIAHWPGRIAPDTESAHVSAFWDFLPTACELAGVALPPAIDGISYLPTLLGSGEQANHELLYWEFPERGYSVAIRQGNWKGVRRDLTTDPAAPLELYDLATDPGETTDVADRHPEVVARLTAALRRAHTPSERFPMPGEGR